jgi:hypothetical protein
MKRLKSCLCLVAALVALLLVPRLLLGQALQAPPTKQTLTKPAPQKQQPAAAPQAAPTTPIGNAPIPLEVDVAEVYRRGDYVERIGQGPRSEVESEYLAAMAPPAGDDHKWFITIVTQKGCAPCEALKSDLLSKPELQAFVNLASPKQGWAHCNIYSIEDETQAWRFAAIQVKSFPTIIVQPPLNKKYGDPSTVVMQQAGYAGGSTQLAKNLSKSIKGYIAKRNATPQPVRSDATHNYAGGFRSQEASEPKHTYPRYTEQPTGGYKQQLLGEPLRPWGVDPPFRPRPKTPVTPAPNLVPVMPDEIPDPLNPNAPTPSIPEPSDDQPSDKSAQLTPHALVVIDGNTVGADLVNGPLKGVLEKLREKYKNLTVEIADLATIKNRFPNLTKTDLPAVVVTDNGVLREALTNLLLPLLTDTDISIPWVLKSLLGGGTLTWLAGGGLAAWLAVRWVRKRREQQGLGPLINSDLKAALVAILTSDRVKEMLDNLTKPKAAPAAPTTTTTVVQTDTK